MNPVDPRAARTDEVLREAIHRLATQKPIEHITVTELCAAAGVSRGSFYRRAKLPAELLVAEFDAAYTQRYELFRDESKVTGRALADAHRATIAVLAGHLEQYGPIYRHSLSVDGSTLLAGLRRHLICEAYDYLDSCQAELVLPESMRTRPWPVTRELLARNYVDGLTAIIEVWLNLPDEDRSSQAFYDWFMALSPPWNRRLMDLGGGRV